MGSKFVEGYHAERIARAKQQATDSIVPPYLYNGKQYNFPTQDIYRMVSTHPDLIEVTPMLQSFEVKASAR